MGFIKKFWKYIVGFVGFFIGLVWFMNKNTSRKVKKIKKNIKSNERKTKEVDKKIEQVQKEKKKLRKKYNLPVNKLKQLERKNQ